MSSFETFTDKGSRLYTATKVASLTLNQHGYLNIPGSVQDGIFDGKEAVEYHADRDNHLLAFEAHDEESAPSHAYKISGEVGESGSVSAEKVLAWVGKRPPEEHTMLELHHDEESGLPYIDVSDLPEMGDSDDKS